MEEKHGKARVSTRGSGASDEGNHPDSDDSTSAEEDDDGILVTEDLEAEIATTLQAIKAKDPRVYDKNASFYSNIKEDATQPVEAKHRPMYLKDYHRMNLLGGYATGDNADEESIPKPYAQEQSDLRAGIVSEMHKASNGTNRDQASPEASETEEGDSFFTAKEKTDAEEDDSSSAANSKPSTEKEDILALAEQDPERFLSNYMASRAWLPAAGSRSVPFESDDEEEEERAEEFEQAFNFRFEDPATSNEKLMSHARDAAAKYSVRRQEPKGRRRAREVEREEKEMKKTESEREKARLRKLKIEENEEKLRKIKEAAGLRGEKIGREDWMKFLEEAWDVEQWENEMERKFGRDYYADKEEAEPESDDEGEKPTKTKRPRKPKWDDDIDIDDLVPDFDRGDGLEATANSRSAEAGSSNSAPGDEEDMEGMDDDAGARLKFKRPKKKDLVRMRREQKKAGRLERRAIEEIVDEKLEQEGPTPLTSGAKAPHFRYRETSPRAYGLTARDILMASDSQLNQFVGLKKLATFRDPEKKRKDKRRLGKKARLRQWRRDTFGTEKEPELNLAGDAKGVEKPQGGNSRLAQGDQHHDTSEGKRRRKRRKVKGE